VFNTVRVGVLILSMVLVRYTLSRLPSSSLPRVSLGREEKLMAKKKQKMMENSFRPPPKQRKLFFCSPCVLSSLAFGACCCGAVPLSVILEEKKNVSVGKIFLARLLVSLSLSLVCRCVSLRNFRLCRPFADDYFSQPNFVRLIHLNIHWHRDNASRR
jgi:hypothetical protein